MKKGKFVAVALIGVLLAGGLVLIGCDFTSCPGGSNPNLRDGYGVGSDKGGCNFSGTTSSIRDCSDRCLEKFADRNPYATSFSCDC
jgi:hypothetical protein